MSLKLSTGLRNMMLTGTGLQEAFNDGVIYIYTGSQPIDADTAVGGQLIGKVTVNAGAFTFGSPTNGLSFDAPVLNVISKAAAEAWSMVATAAGTAGWFRLMGNANDALGASTVLPRIDGSIGISGSDLNLANITFVVSTPLTVDVFQLTYPASV